MLLVRHRTGIDYREVTQHIPVLIENRRPNIAHHFGKPGIIVAGVHVEQLVGDRDTSLDALRGRSWDAVIDNSGYRVKWATDSAELLRDSVDLYLYTSSIGVYYPYLRDSLLEDDELNKEIPPEDILTEVQKLEYGYAVMKTLSEAEIVRVFGEDRTILSRPTYMVGPGDRTDRFTYWPVRLARGGEVMIPGKSEIPIMSPWERIRQRSITFRSSRTLPGQVYALRTSSAAGSMPSVVISQSARRSVYPIDFTRYGITG